MHLDRSYSKVCQTIMTVIRWILLYRTEN